MSALMFLLTRPRRRRIVPKSEFTHPFMKRKAAGAKSRAPRGKRVQNKEKTRKAILRAALELFAEKGFYHTTTKAISRQAGIAEGTLFNYFETKEDLALYFF